MRLRQVKVRKNKKSYRPNTKPKKRVTTYKNSAKSKFKVLSSPRLTEVAQLRKRERQEIDKRVPLNEISASKMLAKIKCSCSQSLVDKV